MCCIFLVWWLKRKLRLAGLARLERHKPPLIKRPMGFTSKHDGWVNSILLIASLPNMGWRGWVMVILVLAVMVAVIVAPW